MVRPGAIHDKLRTGFTLVELLVVMMIISLLLVLAVPRYFSSVQKSQEAVLKENLSLMRSALDKYYGDRGRYPDNLDDLVARKYLRSIPRDPLTDSNSSWVTVPPENPELGAVYDVRSGADGAGIDGSAFSSW